MPVSPQGMMLQQAIARHTGRVDKRRSELEAMDQADQGQAQHMEDQGFAAMQQGMHAADQGQLQNQLLQQKTAEDQAKMGFEREMTGQQHGWNEADKTQARAEHLQDVHTQRTNTEADNSTGWANQMQMHASAEAAAAERQKAQLAAMERMNKARVNRPTAGGDGRERMLKDIVASANSDLQRENGVYREKLRTLDPQGMRAMSRDPTLQDEQALAAKAYKDAADKIRTGRDASIQRLQAMAGVSGQVAPPDQGDELGF